MTLTETSVRLDPLLGSTSALLLAELAPVVDLHVVAALHDVGDVPLGIDLLAVLQDLDLVSLAGGLHVGVGLPLAWREGGEVRWRE